MEQSEKENIETPSVSEKVLHLLNGLTYEEAERSLEIVLGMLKDKAILVIAP